MIVGRIRKLPDALINKIAAGSFRMRPTIIRAPAPAPATWRGG